MPVFGHRYFKRFLRMFCIYFGNFKLLKSMSKTPVLCAKRCYLSRTVAAVINWMSAYICVNIRKLKFTGMFTFGNLPFSSSLNLLAHPVLSFASYNLVHFSFPYICYVLLRLRVQNRRKKWNFPLNFRTMRKLSELYSGIFQNY